MKLRVLFAVAVLGALLVGVPARADNPRMNLYDFRPSVHAFDIGGIWTSHVAEPYQLTGGLWMVYRKDPLNVLGLDGEKVQVISDQAVADLYISMAFFHQLSIGLSVPLFVWMQGDDPTPVDLTMNKVGGFSLGDLRLSAKFKFWENGNKGLGLALGQDLTLPVATGDNMVGEPSVTSLTQLVLDYSVSGYVLAFNAGYLIRENNSAFEPSMADEVQISVGGKIPILCDQLDILASAQTRTYAGNAFSSRNDVATTFMAGLQGRLFGGLVLGGYAGVSAGTMPGVAAWQAMVNIGYEPPTNSCDRDGDGVPDRQDACPELPGPRDTRGCPDRDGDGVLDSEDLCPDIPGKEDLQGCPDQDNDGVPDYQDQCPTIPGPAATKGCPDRDSDGIADHIDQCPEQPGKAEFKGCPDTDKDGIPDHLDQCPKVPGPTSSFGCPDRDGDGILDAEDQCPDVPGKAAYKGCPPPTPKRVQVTREKIVITEMVFFNTNKSKIQSRSFGLLQDVAKVLKDNPWIKKIRVEGHTDDIGNPAANKKLSQARADSVMEFLVAEGVERHRLEASGHGSERPVDPAKTRDARAKNRRVEFLILEAK